MHVPSPRFVNIQTLSGSQAHCNCCQPQLPWVHLQVLLGVLAIAGSDRKWLNSLPAFALPAKADRFAIRADIILPSLPIYYYAAILLTADSKIPKCLTTKTNIISCSPSPWKGAYSQHALRQVQRFSKNLIIDVGKLFRFGIIPDSILRSIKRLRLRKFQMK